MPRPIPLTRITAGLLLGALTLAAGSAAANPADYRREKCRRSYGYGLEDAHRRYHRQAVERDQRNHAKRRLVRTPVGEEHRRIQRMLAMRHQSLAREESAARSRGRGVQDLPPLRTPGTGASVRTQTLPPPPGYRPPSKPKKKPAPKPGTARGRGR